MPFLQKLHNQTGFNAKEIVPKSDSRDQLSREVCFVLIKTEDCYFDEILLSGQNGG